MTSNKRAGSDIRKIFWRRTRWPELLTGKNSVMPCTAPRIIASNILIVYSTDMEAIEQDQDNYMLNRNDDVA
jgi:hypothetical protein